MLLKVLTFLQLQTMIFLNLSKKYKHRVCNAKTFLGFQAMRITGYTRRLNMMEKLTQSWRRIWRLMRWTWPAPAWGRRSPTRTSSGSGTMPLGSCVPSSWLSPCRWYFIWMACAEHWPYDIFIQTGFAILEGGCTTLKNEVCNTFYQDTFFQGTFIQEFVFSKHFYSRHFLSRHFLKTLFIKTPTQVSIMMKNVIDCLMGGISYWAIGHGLTVGGVNIYVVMMMKMMMMMAMMAMMARVMVIVCVGLTSVFPSILEYWMMICLARPYILKVNKLAESSF